MDRLHKGHNGRIERYTRKPKTRKNKNYTCRDIDIKRWDTEGGGLRD
jgi:hypothetical protein